MSFCETYLQNFLSILFSPSSPTLAPSEAQNWHREKKKIMVGKWDNRISRPWRNYLMEFWVNVMVTGCFERHNRDRLSTLGGYFAGNNRIGDRWDLLVPARLALGTMELVRGDNGGGRMAGRTRVRPKWGGRGGRRRAPASHRVRWRWNEDSVRAKGKKRTVTHIINQW